MEFLIADTFLDSLTRLTDQEQKLVKTTVFDLQVNPKNPGMQFHKLDRARDQNFCSVRVNQDVRLIVHQSQASLLICYVNHHEQAYRWAEQRKLETHPTTGAAQIVRIRETVKDIIVPKYVETERRKPPLFGNVPDETLLSYGVPPEWLADARSADEDALLELAEHLPKEAAEALLNLATGATPKAAPTLTAGMNPFEHPDAQRRFRVMKDVEELERAFAYPWEQWTVFLHPAQRQFVEQDVQGPTRISGSAGTGKTIVALHRAVFLARRNPDARILLTTFSDTLAQALRVKLRRLIGDEPHLAARIEVGSMDTVGVRLYAANFGAPRLASRELILQLLIRAARELEEQRFLPHFLLTEWEETVDAWQVDSWEAYRDTRRLGRKTRLSEQQRVALWKIFLHVEANLAARGVMTMSAVFGRLAAHLAARKHPPFDFAVIDEAQDISIAQLRFLAALGGGRPNALFFTGDLGQRIFQQPFSWKALGVEIRGRCRTLRVNYRTSHQIRAQADRLLDRQISDIDGNTETRDGTVSVFNGPSPTIETFKTRHDEIAAVARWLTARAAEGIQAEEIGVVVRSEAELSRAQAAVNQTGLSFTVLDEQVNAQSGQIAISTMHLAKGLEFRAVAVMACDAEILPQQGRIEEIADESDLDEVYATERHLLYVACTRARDHLLVTGVAPASEFLEDLRR